MYGRHAIVLYPKSGKCYTREGREDLERTGTKKKRKCSIEDIRT